MIKQEWSWMVDEVWVCECGSMNSPTLEYCPQCDKNKENENEEL